MDFDTTSICSLIPSSVSQVVISSDAPTQIVNSHGVTFRRSDKVRVTVSPEELELMQENHGGYNSSMARYCYKIGYIHRITVAGDPRVKFGPNTTSPRFTYNPDVLELIYLKGDVVKVTDDVKLLKKCQDKKDTSDRRARPGFGAYRAEEIASMTGKIHSVRSEKVCVLIGSKMHWINRKCLILKESSSTLTSILRRNCPDENFTPDDGPLVTMSESEVKQVRDLTRQMEKILDNFTCTVCLEELRNIVFLCGHGACQQCSNELNRCPMCRDPITRQIRLY